MPMGDWHGRDSVWCYSRNEMTGIPCYGISCVSVSGSVVAFAPGPRDLDWELDANPN